MNALTSSLALAALASVALAQTPVAHQVVSGRCPDPGTAGLEVVLRSKAALMERCRYVALAPSYDPQRDVVALRGVDAYPETLELLGVVAEPAAAGGRRIRVRFRRRPWDGASLRRGRLLAVKLAAGPEDEVVFEDATPAAVQGRLDAAEQGEGVALLRDGHPPLPVELPASARPLARLLAGERVLLRGSAAPGGRLRATRIEFELDGTVDADGNLRLPGGTLPISRGPRLRSLNSIRTYLLGGREVRLRGFVTAHGAFASEVRATVVRDVTVPGGGLDAPSRSYARGDTVWVARGIYREVEPSVYRVPHATVEPSPGFPYEHSFDVEDLDFGPSTSPGLSGALGD